MSNGTGKRNRQNLERVITILMIMKMKMVLARLKNYLKMIIRRKKGNVKFMIADVSDLLVL